MLLQPKKTKYKNSQKGKIKLPTLKNQFLDLGSIGIKACEFGVISNRQIEASRQAIARKLKRNAKLWVKIFPNYPISKKPKEGWAKMENWLQSISRLRRTIVPCM